MVTQHLIRLQPKSRGFHLITDEVLSAIGRYLPESGLFQLFIQHTSAALTINENADPTVLEDFELYFNRIVQENIPGLKHTLEGPDDMPAHIKSSLVGHHVSLPIQNFQLALGQWQGIYLCEFRNRPRSRNVIVTILY